MDIINRANTKNLIAIEYPGRVNNPEKMMETLGGIEELSKAFQEKQKLQLKFRNNFYAKPVLSTEPFETTGMLLKVKVRRSKKNPKEKPKCVSVELSGSVTTVYKFNNFADYQFLPLQRNEKTGKTENIYNDIVPQDITVGPAWFRDKLDVPVFLPPAAFTRTDSMQHTVLKNELNNDDGDDETIKFAVTSRSSRSTHGTSISFNLIDSIPIKPNEAVNDPANNSLIKQDEYEAVSKLFKDRPIWTLSSIRAHMKLPPRRLNHVLSPIAYYYSTGPWRNCFVAFGYDPRKNFDSRFYQMLDFRVRQGIGLKGELQFRRQTGANRRVKVPVKYDGGLHDDNEIEENFQLRRKQAIFDNNTIPPFRALHYQFVDIQVPKIQEMLHKIPSTLAGVCNEKRGWLPVGFIEQCRDILTSIAQANMLKHCSDKNISLEEYKADEDNISETPVGDEEEADSDESVEENQEQEIDEEMEE